MITESLKSHIYTKVIDFSINKSFSMESNELSNSLPKQLLDQSLGDGSDVRPNKDCRSIRGWLTECY